MSYQAHEGQFDKDKSPTDGNDGSGGKRRPGRPALYVFDRPEAELSENELRLKLSIEKRRMRQNAYHQRKRSGGVGASPLETNSVTKRNLNASPNRQQSRSNSNSRNTDIQADEKQLQSTNHLEKRTQPGFHHDNQNANLKQRKLPDVSTEKPSSDGQASFDRAKTVQLRDANSNAAYSKQHTAGTDNLRPTLNHSGSAQPRSAYFGEDGVNNGRMLDSTGKTHMENLSRGRPLTRDPSRAPTLRMISPFQFQDLPSTFDDQHSTGLPFSTNNTLSGIFPSDDAGNRRGRARLRELSERRTRFESPFQISDMLLHETSEGPERQRTGRSPSPGRLLFDHESMFSRDFSLGPAGDLDLRGVRASSLLHSESRTAAIPRHAEDTMSIPRTQDFRSGVLSTGTFQAHGNTRQRADSHSSPSRRAKESSRAGSGNKPSSSPAGSLLDSLDGMRNKSQLFAKQSGHLWLDSNARSNKLSRADLTKMRERFSLLSLAQREALVQARVFPGPFSLSSAVVVWGLPQHNRVEAMNLMFALTEKELVVCREDGQFILSEYATQFLDEDPVVRSSLQVEPLVHRARTSFSALHAHTLSSLGGLTLIRSSRQREELIRCHDTKMVDFEMAFNYSKEVSGELWHSTAEAMADVMRFTIPYQRRVVVFQEICEVLDAQGTAENSVDVMKAKSPGLCIERARLQLALAEAYMDGLMFEKAEPPVLSALVFLTRSNRPTPIEVAMNATALLILAKIRSATKQTHHAHLLLLRALELLTEGGLNETLLGLNAFSNLAGLYLGQGELEKAKRIIQQAISVSQALSLNSSPDFASVLGVRAIAELVCGRYQEAQSLFLQALKTLDAWRGQAWVHCVPVQHCCDLEIWLLEGLAKSLGVLGDRKEAEQVVNKAKSRLSELDIHVSELALMKNPMSLQQAHITEWVHSLRYVY
mmetsp:Transcript_5013/g.8719  ORF Transcript_5013/g.8719 Transcript_5013/m.8719 type:complete len:933 (-) Transcript_5013:553-3351(-)